MCDGLFRVRPPGRFSDGHGLRGDCGGLTVTFLANFVDRLTPVSFVLVEPEHLAEVEQDHATGVNDWIDRLQAWVFHARSNPLRVRFLSLSGEVKCRFRGASCS